MALERTVGDSGCGESDLSEQARHMEQLVQRLLVAEQSEFTEETASHGLNGPPVRDPVFHRGL